jgi:hypothetical protein
MIYVPDNIRTCEIRQTVLSQSLYLNVFQNASNTQESIIKMKDLQLHREYAVISIDKSEFEYVCTAVNKDNVELTKKGYFKTSLDVVNFVPERYKTLELCSKAILKDLRAILCTPPQCSCRS